jgi:hypothetical protein
LNSKLVISGQGGEDSRTLLDSVDPDRILVVGRWGFDRQSLYFSKEPLGLGGYILFGGASNLWVYDFNADSSQALVDNPDNFICIDDLSPDETLLADHCALLVIGVTNLLVNEITVVDPPEELSQANVVGGARFSPDGQRLAFGIARNDPQDEQGWIAVSEDLDGGSRTIATAPPGDYFNVAAWLDGNTIVLQSWGQAPGVWVVGADGSGLQRLSDGIYLGLMK